MFTEDKEKEPMSKQLKPNELLVLMAIAMTQDHTGTSDITIKQILQCVPIGSNKTVQTALEGLLEFRYEGNPILIKGKKTGVNGKEQNTYTLLENPLFAVYGEETLSVNSTLHDDSLSVNITHTKENKDSKEIIKELEDSSMREKMTKKEIVSYFKELLKDKGVDKRIHYPMVYKKMDNQNIVGMLHELKNNEIKRTLEVIVEEYGQGKIKSNMIQYPLDVNVLTRKWVVEKGIQIMRAEKNSEKEQRSQMEKQSVEATERQDKAIQSIMSRIKKKGGQ
ncbi:helix-turn-helix domain-containing protein [Bacillus phage PK2]|nr:helix-turn-helix domain-containing protein [Bacillus phage PK2]